MRWEDIERQFDVEIPLDEPVFPMNIVCELLHMQYYTLHEIMKEGILREMRREKARKEKEAKSKKGKRLFSRRDVKRLKYIQYLIEERGVNIKGVKVILEIEEE